MKASMRNLLKNGLLVLAFCAGSVAALPSQATAQIRKDVDEFAGQRCNTPAKGSGIITGFFIGTTTSPFVSTDDEPRSITRYRCFSSAAECRGWIYTMQSKYSDAGPPTVARCDKH